MWLPSCGLGADGTQPALNSLTAWEDLMAVLSGREPRKWLMQLNCRRLDFHLSAFSSKVVDGADFATAEHVWEKQSSPGKTGVLCQNKHLVHLFYT